MRTNINIESAKVFNVKPLGNSGCRFAVKINSKKQDGSYTKGVFLNCVSPRENLISGEIYNLDGFLGDNEYMDKNTLELIVTKAIMINHLRQRQEPKDQYNTKQNEDYLEKLNKQKQNDFNPFDDRESPF